MDSIDFQLLNEFQKDFPLVEDPFRVIGQRLGLSEEQTIQRYQSLKEEGFLSRIGAVLPPQSLGASTLAAMRVPEDRVEEVSSLVSSLSQVNHNYLRENFETALNKSSTAVSSKSPNLWFVVTAGSEEELQKVIKEISTTSGLEVLDCRLKEEYRIDLGFDLRQYVQQLSEVSP